MKTLCIVCLIFLISCVSEKSVKTTDLLDNNNLEQWDYFLDDSLVSKNDIWHVKDGILYCSGAVNGYLFTNKEYSNYKLSFEWRWPQEAGNSGVLLHITGPHKVWPVCIEAQLKAGNAGDFIMMGGSTIAEQQEASGRRVAKRIEDAEKPVGEWNSYEIICKEDSIEVKINNILQNSASKASLHKGRIGLQSEGKPIEFTNIYIERL